MKPHIQILHCSLFRSINHLFFFSVHWLTKWFSFGNKTITRAPSQTGLPSASDPVKVCQVFDASLPASPHLDRLPPSHGDVGQLSLLASRPAVWDVLPVLQSGGKWWQAYLPWRSLTWKKGRKKKRRLKEFAASLSTFLHSWNPLWEKKKLSISWICFVGIKSVL